MKKITIICFILVLSCTMGFSLETEESELIGSWETHVLLAENEDGLLVNPDAEYAFPFLGISRIDILDSGFILFRLNENEYRAFYEVEMLDFDNYHLVCTFKNGEELLLKLVRLEGESWKFLYRISADSVLAPDDETDDAGEDEEEQEEEIEIEVEREADWETLVPEIEVDVEESSESLYAGILIKE